ncbi:MAG TPA: alpha/beta fold hydrolase, partial [Candidatus Thermoplasmatota archaeon]|nr:alpha/beta fold hydrolase [Candidatus Thermoplasmatota archaeon]
MDVRERILRIEDRPIYTLRVSPSDPRRDARPLLVVHGGPGAPHDYLRALDGLATRGGRDVVYYDQSGCGRSGPVAPEERRIERYAQELGALIDALGLHDAHLFGHSFGGMVALEHALRRPPRSLVLASTPTSM